MDPIVGLLWLCKYGRSTNLQQFEALMALTNLASCGDAIKNSITTHNKGIPIIQSLQYSDHLLVRRAATEAICNLALQPEAQRNFRNKDKLKIWLALADDYEADLATARASAGALALAAADRGRHGMKEWLPLSSTSHFYLRSLLVSSPLLQFQSFRRRRVDG